MFMCLSKLGLAKKPSHEKEALMSDYVPITNFVSPSVIESEDGQLAGILRLEGFYCETASTEAVNLKHIQWSRALGRLGLEFGIQAYVLRKRIKMTLKGAFKTELARSLDRDYHARYQQGEYFCNALYVMVIHKGFSTGKLGKTFQWMSRLSRKTMVSERERYRTESLKKLESKLSELKELLQAFQPRLLGEERSAVLGYESNEILEFLSDLLNGIENQTMVNVHGFASIGQPNDLMRKNFPTEHLGQYLLSKYIYLGSRIQFSDANGQHKFAAVISITNFTGQGGADEPSMDPTMMVRLMRLPCEFIYSTCFYPESNEVSLKLVKAQENRFQRSHDASVTQFQQLSELKDGLSSGVISMGATQTQLLIFADSLEDLYRKTEVAKKSLQNAGLIGIVETFNQKAAFFGMLPFNQRYHTRLRYLPNSAFADLFPMTNYPLGHWNENHLGGAATLVDTLSATPMFFNLHKTGSSAGGIPTVGHTLIVGVTGSGKSVFVAFLQAQFERYNIRSIFFDYNRGLEVPIRAFGGNYYRISPNHPQYSQFNPFGLADTQSNRLFLKTWLAELVRRDEESFVPGEIEKELSACVDYAYDRLLSGERSLSSALQFLPAHFDRRHELDRWLRKNEPADRFSDGAYAFLFDNPNDCLELEGDITGFDLTELLDKPAKVVNLLSMYLFHCIKMQLDGRLTGIWCDEMQQLMRSPYFMNELPEWFATFRKLNAFVVPMTQLPETFLESALSATLIGNTHTHIFFPNDRAHYENYAPFNVTEEEFHFIKTTTDKGYFLYKYGNESTICRLNLSGMDQYLNLFSVNAASLPLCDEARAEVGESPQNWIPLFLEKSAQQKSHYAKTSHEVITHAF